MDTDSRNDVGVGERERKLLSKTTQRLLELDDMLLKNWMGLEGHRRAAWGQVIAQVSQWSRSAQR
jgi:hypothetical protein